MMFFLFPFSFLLIALIILFLFVLLLLRKPREWIRRRRARRDPNVIDGELLEEDDKRGDPDGQ